MCGCFDAMRSSEASFELVVGRGNPQPMRKRMSPLDAKIFDASLIYL
jgi:hypothetical protein